MYIYIYFYSFPRDTSFTTSNIKSSSVANVNAGPVYCNKSPHENYAGAVKVLVFLSIVMVSSKYYRTGGNNFYI